MRVALVIGNGPACVGVPALIAAMRRRGWEVVAVPCPATLDWLGPALLADLCGQPARTAADALPTATVIVTVPYSQSPSGSPPADMVVAPPGPRQVPVVTLPAATAPGGPCLVQPEATCEAIAAAVTPQTLAGVAVLVTAGPTCEDIDPVRFLSNRSTGLMGLELALAAWRHGAAVTLVHGPLRVAVPPLRRLLPAPVRSAAEMHAVVMARISEHQAAILCAAVADFTPAARAPQKIKKAGRQGLTLELVRTPDILAAIGALPQRPFLVGFAAETHDLAAYAPGKLRRKNCDLLCANNIAEPGSGFAVDTNRITLFFRDGSVTALPLLTKAEAAECIVAAVATGLGPQRPATP